jgi:hypothetical protein
MLAQGLQSSKEAVLWCKERAARAGNRAAALVPALQELEREVLAPGQRVEVRLVESVSITLVMLAKVWLLHCWPMYCACWDQQRRCKLSHIWLHVHVSRHAKHHLPLTSLRRLQPWPVLVGSGAVRSSVVRQLGFFSPDVPQHGPCHWPDIWTCRPPIAPTKYG